MADQDADHTVELRQAVPDDVDAICAFDHLAAGETARREFIRRVVSEGKCWVAEVDGQVAGYMGLEYMFFDRGFVSMLYAHPAFRRRGIGTALMQKAETLCRTDGLFTSTNQSNLPMQALLQKLGFVCSGFIENLDPSDPELVYFKRVRTERCAE